MKKLFAAFVMAFCLCFTVSTQTSGDRSLKGVTDLDAKDVDAAGKLITLPAAEHITRGFVYMDNRHFPEAKLHFQRVLDVYPNDPLLPRALFGMGRSLMWERKYLSAIPFFNRVSTEFPTTKDGRESLAFMGACHVRIGKNDEAAKIYERYVSLYPTGEKIDSAHLNIIDALREAGKYDAANQWVDKAKVRFTGTPTAVNAMQARVRLEIHRQNWPAAVAAADDLLLVTNFAGSMATAAEIKYLKGIALESSGKRADALTIFASIPDVNGSYWGGLASDKLTAGNRVKRTVQIAPNADKDFPVMYRSELLQYAKPKGIDPRFVLAIMKQESSFRTNAKSPAAARGLLQLVYDTAVRYNERAGFADFAPDDLYKPSVNIAIGTAYMHDLKDQFDGLYEAIAASYNGGEDNAARWMKRTKPKTPGIFTSEIGFAETKNYVYKVMTNYRVYRELYDENLVKR
ncbi:MAG: transglycosylase SLT domain-containing protein [Pyrinomonadaceae bacterium]|nr:transglycosylase SLT domain-containing protein [Pyrinomonadaceae bacterium]